MSPNNSSNKKSRNLDDKNHVLDLPTGTRLYVKGQLYNKNKEIRSYTLFFRSDGILPANGLTKKKIKPIPIKETAQLTKQSIPIKKREK
jgi:hypothetical protein